jgi:hypothetical protein
MPGRRGGRKQELPEFYFKCFKALQYKKQHKI